MKISLVLLLFLLGAFGPGIILGQSAGTFTVTGSITFACGGERV